MIVILAPYGLNGTLTGQSYRDTDQHAHKILDEWSRFYPIEQTDKDGDPPALIEVLVGKQVGLVTSMFNKYAFSRNLLTHCNIIF